MFSYNLHIGEHHFQFLRAARDGEFTAPRLFAGLRRLEREGLVVFENVDLGDGLTGERPALTDDGQFVITWLERKLARLGARPRTITAKKKH